MSEIKIINETPLSLVETKVILEKIEQRDKELSEKAIKTKEHINRLTKKTEKDFKELKSKLENASISRLKDKHIAKIIEIKPNDIESIKALFASEPITLKQEDLQKILECLK